MKKLILLMLLIASIGCSKSSNEEPIIESKSYTVPIELTINGITKPSTVTVVDAVPLGFCTNDFILNSKTNTPDSNNFGISISHFKAEGFTFNGNEATIGEEMTACDKIELIASGGSDDSFLSKSINGGKVTVSGKIYTLTCNAKKTPDTNPNTIYTITATWTRP